jgi:hypothetical protein
MNKEIYILILLLASMASCSQISEKDISGSWHTINEGLIEPLYWEIDFKDNTVSLNNDNGFRERGKFQIENGILKIELNRDNFKIETRIEVLAKDSILLFEKTLYKRQGESLISNNEYYELIGLPTENFLTQSKVLSSFIHFYKGADNKLILRMGEKISEFSEIPMFLSGPISNSKVNVFIGKGIELSDLKELYIRLIAIHKFRVTLCTKREGINSTHVFNDKIDIWGDVLEKELLDRKLIPLPPPPKEISSKSFYLESGGKEINISTESDFSKINELRKEINYAISINEKLSIANYIKLKQMILEKKEKGFQINAVIE